MVDTGTPAIDDAARRQLAIDLFNHVWTLIGTPDRTREQDTEMIHAAHASRHHWGEVGTPVNFARGEWQVSRVYSVLGRAEPALVHARLCLDTCVEHGIGDSTSPTRTRLWPAPTACSETRPSPPRMPRRPAGPAPASPTPRTVSTR